jgi:long-chain acyl-CoA synthetase
MLTEAELLEYSAQRLAAYKRPREVRFLDALPMTSTGKIARRELIRYHPSSAEKGNPENA